MYKAFYESQNVGGVFDFPSTSFRKTPGGQKVLGLKYQYQENLYGGYMKGRVKDLEKIGKVVEQYPSVLKAQPQPAPKQNKSNWFSDFFKPKFNNAKFKDFKSPKNEYAEYANDFFNPKQFNNAKFKDFRPSNDLANEFNLGGAKPVLNIKIPQRQLNLSEGLKIVSLSKNNISFRDLIQHNKLFDKTLNLSEGLSKVSKNKGISFRDLIKAEQAKVTKLNKKTQYNPKDLFKDMGRTPTPKPRTKNPTINDYLPKLRTDYYPKTRTLTPTPSPIMKYIYGTPTPSPSPKPYNYVTPSPTPPPKTPTPTPPPYNYTYKTPTPPPPTKTPTPTPNPYNYYLPPIKIKRFPGMGGSGGGEVKGSKNREKVVFYNELEQILNLFGTQKPQRRRK
jgi:hypothetical protein